MLERLMGKTREQIFDDMVETTARINEIQKLFKNLSDEDLLRASLKLKNSIKSAVHQAGRVLEQEERKEVLDKYLIDAFAIAKEAVHREYGFELNDVQVIGGIALHNGEVSQLATGEGKTLMAALPAYLNAMTGDGVHVITPNDYLAERDAAGNGKIYKRLGLSTAYVPAGRKAENMELIKEAFASDITYASASELGFNYLHDGLALDNDGVVNSPNRYTYAIIDEVDSVLLDDATIPLVISGISEADKARDLHGAIASIDENYAEESRRAALADDAVYRIFSLDREKQDAFRKYGDNFISEKQLVYYAATTYDYDLVLNNRFEKKKAQEVMDSHALILDKSTGNFTLTEAGMRIISKYYIGNQIEKAFLEDINHMRTIKDSNGKQKYKYDEDYYVLAYGDQQYLKLTEHGYEKLIRDRDSERVNEIYDGHKFASEINGDLHEINNAIKAYWTLENGKDYVLSSVEEGAGLKAGYDNQKLTIVSAGRTAESRVYSDGLQMALEKKEARLANKEKRLGKVGRPVRIVETKSSPELASISQSSFFSLYQNVGGMTGTSAKEAFEMMYGWETTELPKNVVYQKRQAEAAGISQKPETIFVDGKEYIKPSGLKPVRDEFYFSYIDENGREHSGEAAKINKLIQELRLSMQKKQPVLISTTSVKESEKIHKVIKDQLGIDVPLLNANTKNEAEIIAGAGKAGAITISTEMAGRGTDIKLAGEKDENKFKDVFINLAKSKFVNSVKERNLNFKTQAELSLAQKDFMDKNRDDLRLEATILWEKEHEEEKNRILLAGGLKVVGVGHFKFDRSDRQLVGRTARQSDAGEAIFISSESDLARIDLYPSDYQEMVDKALRSGKKHVEGRAYTELIRDQQAFNENMTASGIKNKLESEMVIQELRLSFRKGQDQLKSNDDYIKAVDYMIEKSVEQVIRENSSKSLKASTKLVRSKLDFYQLQADAKEYLGIDLPATMSKRSTVKDLSRHMALVAKENHHKNIVKNMTAEEYKETHGVQIMDMFADTWGNFTDKVEDQYRQEQLHAMANNDSLPKLEYRLRQDYNQSVREGRMIIASYVLTGKERNYYYDRQEAKVAQDAKDNAEEYNTSNKPVKNFYARDAASILQFTNISLNKSKAKGQTQMQPPVETNEEVVSMNFRR